MTNIVFNCPRHSRCRRSGASRRALTLSPKKSGLAEGGAAEVSIGKAERKDPAIDDKNLFTARLELHVPRAASSAMRWSGCW